MALFIMYLHEFDCGHFDLTNFRTGVIYNNNENILNSCEHLKIESRKGQNNAWTFRITELLRH